MVLLCWLCPWLRLLALSTLQRPLKKLKALSPWQSPLSVLGIGLMNAAFHPISARVGKLDEGHKLWWEGQALMTIDSLHEAANERIDSCFKLSRRGGVAVTGSTSLSLLPVVINSIYGHFRETLPFPPMQSTVANVQGRPSRSYLFFAWCSRPSQHIKVWTTKPKGPYQPLKRLMAVVVVLYCKWKAKTSDNAWNTYWLIRRFVSLN